MQKDLPYDIQILLKQIAKDDEQAFRAVFDRYKEPFHATAFKMTRSADIAEEIVQEVFVTLWVKRKLVATAKKPEGYVFTILHNCIYAHFRKLVLERQLKSKMAQVEEQSENRIETLLLEKENRTIIENIISQLPPQQKLIYKLAKQEGVSREDIAKQLNISPNTVRNLLATAVDYLRTYLKKNESAIIWAVILIHL
jgi:RNA polymerase sigma-70 factor (ECF subfamily)